MEYVLGIAFFGLVAFLAFDRPIVFMEFKDGELVKQKGKIPSGFLYDCKEIGKRWPFSGKIKVYRNTFNPGKLVLTKTIDKKVQQRIRNIFPEKSFKL
ncbi:DUF3634 family protein [Veronia pacifica]|uniref:DUF3634 domain-containing protein n=1 Tax=Veronia pacifica TaxID=1080227 RepID=A0A1C3EBQ3_9GAMM|nr:DUF3634 family protein [Veronia pacifica]ODA30672.1 hypothetical protein A8L45_19555 [Veronia pacifica]